LKNNYKHVLKGISPDDYGDNYSEHLLRMYHSYLQSAESISNRRQKANSFFLTVNSGLVGLIGYLDLINNSKSSELDIFIPIAIAGIALCFLWYRILRCYKDLNSAKFKIVHQIEKFLPIQPYDAEWEAVGRGKDPQVYLPFTKVEVFVPWVFMTLHIFVLIRSIPWVELLNIFH
jgi:hypothetical protein